MVLATLMRPLLFLLIWAAALSADEEPLLRDGDIKKVMNQIFSQHVEKKEMTPEILKNSFHNYIDQFDPQRIYLLDYEVAPFIKMSDESVKQQLKAYQHNDYSMFEQLNDVIQKSILRAEENRANWINHKASYASQTSKSSPENYLDFAKTPAELKERQARVMFSHMGPNLPQEQQVQYLKEYDKNRRLFENQYLFLQEDGTPLTAQEKENLLAIHIIKALAKSLDAHTSFFNPNEAYDLRVRLEKVFDGVGLILGQTNSGFRVIKILPGSPAEQSGRVAINDSLLKIDGKDILNETLAEVMQMLRGKNGSSVDLELSRQMPDNPQESVTFNVQLRRVPITIDEGRVETSFKRFDHGIIGVIKLQAFYQGTTGVSSERDVRKAIEELQKKGPLKGLILDLRDNSGGFLTQAVKVAGLFITNGVIVVSKYSNGEEKFYRDMDGKTSYDGPLVVLTSRVTASAAEIVAQALQDYGVALVVGDEQTYGKGTIQSQTVTDEGSNNASYFKVTVGKYYTVSGKTPQIQGVKADVVVPSPYSQEHIGEEYLEYPISSDHIPDSYVDRLIDIDPSLRPWYLKYYMPTLQKRNFLLNGMVPQLRKLSQERIAKNYPNQDLIKKENEAKLAHLQGKEISDPDPQLNEAINIVKDIIVIEAKMQNQKN